MSFINDLNTAIDKYFITIFTELNFELFDEDSQGMGALKKYKNKDLKVQIINDRGLINLDISSNFGKENFRDAEIINSLIEIDESSKTKIGKWEREKILNKRLDLESQATLIKENWDTLIQLFNFWNHKKTIKRIDKLGLERSNIMFGQK